MSLLNWTQQQLDVGYFLVEYLLDNDPTGQILFKPSDVWRFCNDKWLYSGSAYSAIVTNFRTLKLRGELVQPHGDYKPYQLSKDGYLFKLLKLYTRHNKTD